MASTKQMQERAKARKAAEKQAQEPKMRTGLPSDAKFIITLAVNTKTGEKRFQVTKPSAVMDMFDLMGDASVCEHMVERYIARDDDLAQIEMMHFTNWCYGLQNSGFKSHIQARILGAHTLEDAKAVLEKAVKHFS